MPVKEVPNAKGEPDSGSFARDPTAFAREALKVVTLAPGTVSHPDLEDGGLEALRSDPYLGCTIDGRYKVETRLGEGGMGVVYRCTHKIIGKKVAMKVLRADLARDTEATERFLNEAKAASSIGNPHIIDISDFGQFPDGSTYFVMEFLEGIPLSATLADGRSLPIERIVNIATELCEGLLAAHESQIVHRDLKPDNVFLVTRGQNKDFVKILDFGIAKVSTAEGKLTRAGAVFGTPHYMSPEQAAGMPVDHRGDIYSFGVILYELTSGRVPFDADNFMGILTQHMYKTPVPISALVPQREDVPPGLEAIILKCLSKRPSDRYASMDQLLGDLTKLRMGGIPDAVAEMMKRSGSFAVPNDYFARDSKASATAPETQRAFSLPRWPVLAAVAAAFILLSMLAFVVTRSSGGAEAPAPQAEPTDLNLPTSTKAQVEPTRGPAEARRVVLAVEPLDAHAFIGDTDLGQSPVFVEVPEGGTASVHITRAGFESQTIVLDGTEGKRSIKLVESAKDAAPTPTKAKPRSKPAPASKPAAPKHKPSIGGSEIINPWG